MGALIIAVREGSSADKKEENSKDVGEKAFTVGGLV